MLLIYNQSEHGMEYLLYESESVRRFARLRLVKVFAGLLEGADEGAVARRDQRVIGGAGASSEPSDCRGREHYRQAEYL